CARYPPHLASFPTRRSSDLLALGPMGAPAVAQSSALERSMPDFTQVVEQTEASVVNIRTTETVRVRNRMGPGSNDPYEMFRWFRSEEHTSELQSREKIVCRL